MPRPEIGLGIQAFRQGEKTGLELAVAEETEWVYGRWLEDPDSKVLQYTLTYVLDDQDLVQDDLAYIGFIDDWYVLCACKRLV